MRGVKLNRDVAAHFLYFARILFKQAIDPFKNVNYIPKAELDKECWVRALRKLEELEKDKEVVSCALLCGEIIEGGKRYGHAWIAYQRKENGKIIEYAYDPAHNKFIGRREKTK